MRKHYADSRHGQIHLRCLPARGTQAGAALVCLHPTPYSGLFFETIAPHLAAGRQVVAPDYPGYGGSAAGSDKPGIAEFAEAMCDALGNSGINGPFDLLGFHTGCLVAAEMSLMATNLVRRLVLVDVPFFDAEKRKEMHAAMTKPPVFTAAASCLENAWQRNVAARWEVLPLARSLELFSEEMRAGQRVTRGFHAAFTYACEERFAAVSEPAIVIATQSSLLEPSRAAAKVIPQCRLQECPEVQAPAMETGAPVIAAATLEFLND